MKLLSFIIPSFNCERYLEKCVHSMLDASILDQLEILIVNDGSTDATEEIAGKLCAQYPQTIRLISQENRGHGGALNAGCAAAAGKYLKVVDADDWVETESLPLFLKLLAECDSDVVLTHFFTRNISTGETQKWKSYPREFGRSYSMEQIMSEWKSFDRSMTLHGITYRTDFYRNNGIGLSEHVFYEDYEYATIPCCYAKSVTPLDLFVYDYRIGDVNQSVSDANQLKRISHTETVLNRLIREFPELTLPPADAGREYFCRKTQGLLLSYITTTLLVEKDRKKGRQLAHQIMALFQDRMPGIYALARRQYQVFRMMNLLHISKQTWEKILRSRLYCSLRGKHDFE